MEAQTNATPTIQVRAGIFKALLAGTIKQGTFYGSNDCNCHERLKAAGISLAGLNGLGFSLQCEAHHAYMGTTRVPEQFAALDVANSSRVQNLNERRAAYKAHHGVGVDPKVTENTCPSGLRRVTYPSGWKANEVGLYTIALKEMVRNAADDDLVVIPGIDRVPVLNGGAPNAANAMRAPVDGVTGPKAYRSTVFQFAAIAASIERIIANAKEADDEIRAKDAIEAITNWGWAAPVSLFDAGLWDGKIRPGAKVTLVGESAHIRAKTMGGTLLTDGGGYEVSFSDDSGIKVVIPGRKLPLFLKPGEFVRWIAKPVIASPTGPKFAAGDCITHSAFGEGEVLSVETVNGVNLAKCFFVENDLGEVDGIDLADLTKIG